MKSAMQALDDVLDLIDELAQRRHPHESAEHAQRRTERVKSIRLALRRILLSRFPPPLHEVEHELRTRIRSVGNGDPPLTSSGGRRRSGHSDPVAAAALGEVFDTQLLRGIADDLQAIHDEHAQAATDDLPPPRPRSRRRVRVERDADVDQVLQAWIDQHVTAAPEG